MQQYRNSVLQIICIRGQFDPYRPHLAPLDRKSRGSGFIVDIDNGIVLTNAHVCRNALSLHARMVQFGEENLPLKLISICAEKDVALCQLRSADIKRILTLTHADEINLQFGDDWRLQETDAVMAVGYPLGQKNIKFTTGVVSGFQTDEDNGDDSLLSEEETPSYIQITAPINPGNSGGPLLNEQGQIVGINAAGYMFSQNIAYAIGSRTVLAIYSQLIAPLSVQTINVPHRVITPKYALSYHNASPDLLQSAEGVYISEVYPNSAFTQLQSGDILATIQYYDVYTQQGNTADINAYGQITLDNNLPQRRRTIKEIFDTIPVLTPVTLTIWRQSQKQRLIDIFVYQPSTIRYPVYPAFTPYAYLVAAGYSIGELTYDHIDDGIISLNKYMKRNKRYQPRLVILQVLPQTTASQMQVFDQGTLLSQVNGVTVNTLDELRSVLDTLKPQDIISMVSDKLERFDIIRQQAAQEDVVAARTLQMPSTANIYLAT